MDGKPILNCVAMDRYETTIAQFPDNAYGERNADFLTAVNPAMIKEMIAEIKDLHIRLDAKSVACCEYQEVEKELEQENEKLEKEADWLARKLEVNIPSLHEDAGWRESARKFVRCNDD